VALPEGSGDEFLLPCFTAGQVHLRTLARKPNEGESSTDQERYAFRAWALTGTTWSGPASVDLGPVDPTGKGSQLCSGGRFTATNRSAGGKTVALGVGSAGLTQQHLTVADLGRLSGGGPARAGIADDGTVVAPGVDGTFTRLSGPAVATTGTYVTSSETAGVIDLLISPDPLRPSRDATPARLSVITLTRS
jgi:hypothetical protein